MSCYLPALFHRERVTDSGGKLLKVKGHYCMQAPCIIVANQVEGTNVPRLTLQTVLLRALEQLVCQAENTTMCMELGSLSPFPPHLMVIKYVSSEVALCAYHALPDNAEPQPVLQLQTFNQLSSFSDSLDRRQVWRTGRGGTLWPGQDTPQLA